MPVIIAAGNTYPAKDALKAAGYQYRNWTQAGRPGGTAWLKTVAADAVAAEEAFLASLGLSRKDMSPPKPKAPAVPPAPTEPWTAPGPITLEALQALDKAYFDACGEVFDAELLPLAKREAAATAAREKAAALRDRYEAAKKEYEDRTGETYVPYDPDEND